MLQYFSLPQILSKVDIFTWLLAKEAVLTHDNLTRRGFQMCSKCYLCGEKAETISHLFLHCSFTIHIWRIFIGLRGIPWAMPGRILDILASWNKEGSLSRDKERWRIVPASIWWTVWEERNQRCFEEKSNNIQKIKMKCLVLFYFWCKGKLLEDSVSILDALDSL